MGIDGCADPNGDGAYPLPGREFSVGAWPRDRKVRVFADRDGLLAGLEDQMEALPYGARAAGYGRLIFLQ
jgi:hypothetical protein